MFHLIPTRIKGGEGRDSSQQKGLILHQTLLTLFNLFKLTKKNIMNRIRSSITSKCRNGSSLFVFRWLQHVQKEMNLKEDERNVNLTWCTYNASLLGNQQRLKDLSVLPPLFRESSKSPAIIKHGLDIIKIAVDEVNKEQASAVVFDQPLCAIAKRVQWNWK